MPPVQAPSEPHLGPNNSKDAANAVVLEANRPPEQPANVPALGDQLMPALPTDLGIAPSPEALAPPVSVPVTPISGPEAPAAAPISQNFAPQPAAAPITPPAAPAESPTFPGLQTAGAITDKAPAPPVAPSPQLVEVPASQVAPAPAAPTPDWEGMAAPKTPIEYGALAPDKLDAEAATAASPESTTDLDALRASADQALRKALPDSLRDLPVDELQQIGQQIDRVVTTHEALQ